MSFSSLLFVPEHSTGYAHGRQDLSASLITNQAISSKLSASSAWRERDEFFVVPELVEPVPQIQAVAVVGDLQVQFDVGGGAVAETADGKVGASDESFFDAIMVDVIELAVEEVAPPDGADADLLPDPVRALPGYGFLAQTVPQLQLFLLDPIGLRLRSVRIQAFYETGFAEEEAEPGDLFKRLSKPGIGVDGEIGGDDREVRVLPDVFPEKVTDATSSPVVPDGRHRQCLCI